MSLEAALLLVLLGVAVGGVGTLVGAGGGFLLTPVLLLVYPHDSPRTITAISLAAVWANSTSGSLAYARQRRIDLRSGVIFGIATLPGAVGGALLVRYVPRHVFDGLMAAALAAVAVVITVRGERPHAREVGASRIVVDRGGREWRYRVPEARGVLYSLAVGFASTDDHALSRISVAVDGATVATTDCTTNVSYDCLVSYNWSIRWGGRPRVLIMISLGVPIPYGLPRTMPS